VAGNNPLLLKIVLRVPAIKDRGEKVMLFVNDVPTPIAVHEASGLWSNVSLQIDTHLLYKGINKLTVTWPCTVAAANAQVTGAATEAAFLKALYPVTGEIWSLTADVMLCKACSTGNRRCLCETGHNVI
jgi:hypothetical protein